MRQSMKWLVRVRFRVRTILAIVAGTAVIFVASTRWIPYALWRLRLERAITGKIEADTPVHRFLLSEPTFKQFHDLSDAELLDFRRDPEFLVGRLLRAVGGEGDEPRRINALKALDKYLDEVEGPELPRRFVARAVELVASGTLPAELEATLAASATSRAWFAGMTPADREALRERARAVVLSIDAARPEVAWGWAGALASLGGRGETEIVADLVDRWTGPRRDVVFQCGLGMTRRPDLVPRFRICLDDPVLARQILTHHGLLREQPEGRSILLDYALDTSRPAELRRLSVGALAETEPGRDLVLGAARDPARQLVLDALPDLGPDVETFTRDVSRVGRHARAWHFFSYAAADADPAR
ncbi:MAG TPA: hypothetical protein VGH33_15650, partial [Isosphaeraceae bacterium]